MERQKRRAGRPAKPVLGREIIAQQALELVVADGLDRLTMNQLAKKLGVAVSALYNHVDNKADVVLLIQDALVSQVSLEVMLKLIARKATLEEALSDWARSYRTVFAEYPSLIPLIAVTPVSDAPQTLRMYNTVAQAMLSAGIPDESVMRVIIAFESFLFGSALDINAPPTIFDASDSSVESAWLQRVVSASMTQQQVERADASHPKDPIDRQNFYADVPFRFGLDALIRQTLTLVEP